MQGGFDPPFLKFRKSNALEIISYMVFVEVKIMINKVINIG
mgnify:CR=1 FL=1